MQQKHLISRIILIFFLFGWFFKISAQDGKTLEQLINKEYPTLYKNYKEKLNKQSATYIFAVDFSTSMKKIEPIVKKNVEIFINSLPDGDRFTIIKEGETAGTNYIYLPNAKISKESKNAIIKNIYQTPFSENGSDGFKLTQKILEAANQTGGNDLIYIFIFTDFEYYTLANGFDKTKCEWKSLKKKYSALSKGKKIVKVGLELSAKNLRQNAIFKTDLNNIFGDVQYYQIFDGASLTNWFTDTRANILRDRLNFIVNKEIEHELSTSQFHLKPIQNQEPECWVENKTDLIQSIEFVGPDDLKTCNQPLVENPFVKNYTKLAEVKLNFNEKYNNLNKYNEVDKLLQGSTNKQVSILLHQPQALVPWWLALIILLILLFLAGSTLITHFRKITRIWNISVSWKDKQGKSQVVSESFRNPKQFAFGNGDIAGIYHLSVPDAHWKVKIETRSNFPFFFWIKPGYYLTLEQGEIIELEYPFDRDPIVIGVKRSHFLSSPKKFKGGQIKIVQEKTVYNINIV